MKRTFLLILLSLSINSSYTQSLSIEETIEYINKVNRENPSSGGEKENASIHTSHWREISLTKDGKLSIISYAKVIESDHVYDEGYLTYFYVADLDLIDEKNSSQEHRNGFLDGFKVNCKNSGQCIVSNINFNDDGGLNNCVLLPLAYNISLYDVDKLKRAYLYLFHRIYENGTYTRTLRGDDSDPFAPKK
jgi:hypothetical protein